MDRQMQPALVLPLPGGWRSQQLLSSNCSQFGCADVRMARDSTAFIATLA